MGRREGDLARFCCLVFLLMIYGSGGLSVSSPFAISPSSTDQDLRPAPPHSVESRNIQAPSPLILPIGSVAHPPVIPPSKSEVASPMVQGIVPSAQLSSVPYHSMSGPVSTSPSIQPRSPNDVSPVIHSAAPSISMSPLTPALNEHKSPRLISQPHANQVPNIFRSSDHDLSPSHVNPPSIQVRNGTPTSDTWRELPNGSRLILPHAAAPAPTIVPLSPPGVQSNVPKLAPSMTHPPGAKELSGSSPAISPMPLESNVTHDPSALHPHSPEGRITASPMLAPEISIPGHVVGKTGENPTLAPSYPSASPHPSAPYQNNRRGHYPPTAFVQAPVVSPAHHPSPIPNDNRNYAPPVISPAPLFPSPWNKGILLTPPFVISPAPGNSPTENPKHRIRHLSPLPRVEGPVVHPTPSHHPTPFSKNNRRPHAPSPYVDGPVVIPAPSHPPMDIQRSKRNHHTPPSYHQGPYFPPVQAPFFSPSGQKAATPTQSPLTPQRHIRWPIHYPVRAPSTYSKRSQLPLRSIHALRPSPPNIGPAVIPVVAPTTGTSSHLSPTNNSQFDGSSPAIRPMPLESNVTHAPSTMHPHSPVGRITANPMLAPEISIPGHEDGKRGGNPTLAPSYPSGPICYPVPSPSTYTKTSQLPLLRSIHALPPSPPNFGPAVSPVVAPTTGTSSHLSPTNNSQFDGSSPAISPVPLESNVTHDPSTLHPHSPEGRITASPMLAPEISIPGHEVGKRGENPTLAPSYPSASPHPSVPYQNNRREHYPPTAFVQAPVVSPAHHPSSIPNDNRNYAPPVISPAPLFPSPWNKGRLRTPPFVISPAPGNPPTENPKHRIRHLAPLPSVEGPEVHPTPSHHPTPFSKNNKRPHAPSPYVDGPVVIPAPSHPPMDIQRSKRNHHTPPSYHQGPYFPPVQAPFFSPSGEKAATPTQSPLTPQRHIRWPIHYPVPAPSTYSKRSQSPLRSIHALRPSPPNIGPIHYPASSPSTYSIGSQSPLLQPIQALPPPPPNLDCGPITCQEPLANPPPASPCTCVLPIKVGLRLGVALYTFFPLVSEFAQEISSGIFMKQSQVRIMGANAASEDPEKTVVLIYLVPLGKYFDNTTVILTYVKFWHKQVAIQPSYFGDYDVLYVQYPGLPPSPPSAPGYINVNGGAYSSGNNARAIQPLGVDVRRQKGKLSGSLIAIIVLSSVIASFLIVGAACFLLLRRREHSDLPAASSQPLQTRLPKPSASGAAPMTAGGSVPSSTSASFSSSIATLTGSAKSYSLVEMEKATNKFDDSKIIGEGGFGRVYHGILEDGARVAVKVLKRDDHQGGREFLAEVEMLSRLHHRNLVKLMGICTEENARCLVYELIPNGSLESHLHGVDKEVSPLDWNTRMKIALGAARGLAYLHEDSSPRVIHRDFKSSNILLEHDFTPKVSDFGLARTALDEGNVQISTRVMGTFGYVAPEYAMTGHLLVKSDVYSYGVVLLELLTGKKPVDMSQPPGQENLVSWARPLLTKAEGLEMLIDPALGTKSPHDSIAKVAAIASMCVHPEVSHRPFMGEVVQALKLVCSESDESRHSESCSNEETSTRATDTRINIGLCQGPEMIGSSQSVMFYTSAGFTGDASGLLQMHSSSGPLRTGRGSHFWHRLRELASGSASEHRFAHRFWTTSSEHSERWP